MPRPRTSWPVWLRRFSQSAFFLLFVSIFLATVYQPVNQTTPWAKLFFLLDPLSALSSTLAAHALLRDLLLLGAITLAITFLFGRWFCGWLCPFGALHQLFSSLRSAKPKARIETSGYSRFQKSKYYLLFSLLAAALFGLNLFGLLDPFSFLYRSLAMVVFPAFNDLVSSAFAWIYRHDPALGPLHATSVSEPLYNLLRRHILAASQPFAHGAATLALLFAATLALNLFRPRFWCRYVCPLGALLGLTGKNPAIRLHRIDTQCNECGLCVADCQGGADPSGANSWKPAECLYCYNCHSACPRQALVFLPGSKENRP